MARSKSLTEVFGWMWLVPLNAQLPLHAASMSKDQWLVQGAVKDKEGRTQVGGNFGVWVNKHTGCVKVMERIK
jgi:hypothetical protein